jgi:hypothetical protein
MAHIHTKGGNFKLRERPSPFLSLSLSCSPSYIYYICTFVGAVRLLFPFFSFPAEERGRLYDDDRIDNDQLPTVWLR